MIVFLYVDEMIFTGNYPKTFYNLKKTITKEFRDDQY